MRVKDGFAMAYYCFDVATEIALSKLETVLGTAPTLSTLSHERIAPAYVQYKIPPLLVRLGSLKLDIDGKPRTFDVEAKLYDFGVVTVRFRTGISGSFEDIRKLSFELTGNKELEAEANRILEKIVAETKGAMTNPMPAEEKEWEDYIIFKVKRFDKAIGAKQLLVKHKKELASCLRCEKEMSDYEIENAVKAPLSYYPDELAIVDWNAAFIYDKRESYDVADVIEFAVISLLELRAYDKVLDKALDKAYDDIKKPSRISLNPYGKALDFLSQTKLEVSEVVDKVEHSLKLIGDLYLGKVCKTAASRFYLDSWKEGVKDKLNTIESMYKLLTEKTQTNRMVVLEVMIVLLFVFDLVIIAIAEF